LRKTVDSGMKVHYSNLNKKHKLMFQTLPNHLKKDGKSFLEYGSLEKNQNLKYKKELWNYAVKNHLELSRLYMQASLILFSSYSG
jgi:hypothetical protein